jgi:molybdate transport system substrate-binding protein
MPTRRRRLPLAIAALLALTGAACGDDEGAAGPASGPRGSITVSAASSLTEAFTALGERFEAAHPGTNVEFNFAASSELVTQIEQGAPVDVFASADEESMDRIVEAGRNDGTPFVFARNRLAIAVERGNPKSIATLADLAEPDLVVVLCAEAVSCGAYTAAVLDRAGVRVVPKSYGESVKATLTPVELGEADAAIVYATDVRSGEGVDGVAIPDPLNVTATLPVVALAGSDNPALAAAWVGYVTSPTAGRVLADDYGFLAPS